MATTVETVYGTLEGTDFDDVHSFKGVPYAAPPVGSRRWMPPVRPNPWSGIRPARVFGSICPQDPLTGIDTPTPLRMIPGDQAEDCLYLNVWTPGCDDQARPTLVWVHGGGYCIGAGSQPTFDGGKLARRGDVVVVTINYRLGPLGFLNLAEVTDGAISATGNEGLLDVIAALEWIQENIARFGGSPQNVTLFGQSSGGGAVCTLMTMPAAKGLFHKGIAQSGFAHDALSLEHATCLAYDLIEGLGIQPREHEMLRSASPARLLEVTPSIVKKMTQPTEGFNRYPHPVIDGRVVPTSIVSAFEAGTAAGIPVVIGTTRDEMAEVPIPGNLSLDIVLDAMRTFMPRGIDPSALAHTYKAARLARSAGTSTADVVIALLSDLTARIPATRLLEAQRAHEKDVYSYIFSWTAPAGDGSVRSPHTIELGFVFGTYDLDETHSNFFGQGPAAAALASAVQESWTAFARTGNPSTDALGCWPQYGSNRTTMIIGERTHVVDSPFEVERSAWDCYANDVLADPGFDPK